MGRGIEMCGGLGDVVGQRAFRLARKREIRLHALFCIMEILGARRRAWRREDRARSHFFGGGLDHRPWRSGARVARSRGQVHARERSGLARCVQWQRRKPFSIVDFLHGEAHSAPPASQELAPPNRDRAERCGRVDARVLAGSPARRATRSARRRLTTWSDTVVGGSARRHASPCGRLAQARGW